MFSNNFITKIKDRFSKKQEENMPHLSLKEHLDQFSDMLITEYSKKLRSYDTQQAMSYVFNFDECHELMRKEISDYSNHIMLKHFKGVRGTEAKKIKYLLRQILAERLIYFNAIRQDTLVEFIQRTSEKSVSREVAYA